MKAYGRKAQDRKNRDFILDEARRLMEYADLAWLTTMRRSEHFGRVRLERHYLGFQDTYDYYKKRYLTEGESTILGGRIDTWVLKRHLLQIGVDYDKLANDSYLAGVKGQYGKYEDLQTRRAIVMREVVPVIEHASLVNMITAHEISHHGKTRIERVFLKFQADYNEYRRRYLSVDEETLTEEPAKILKTELLGIGFDYDALVQKILKG